MAERLANGTLNALAFLFIHTHALMLTAVVRVSTGLRDTQAIPREVRRPAAILCGVSTFFLFVAFALAIADRAEALAALALSGMGITAARWWLRRRVWGPQAGQGRVAEVLRRLWQVIRHGVP